MQTTAAKEVYPMSTALTRENIRNTHKLIEPHIRRTPVIEAAAGEF